jgi:Family of unknown function (DUF5309)
MATFQTYQVNAIKEDISDIISNISPTKTPFLSSIGNEKVTQPLFQWQEDSLRGVNGLGTIIEGADAAFIGTNATTMRQNYTQVFMEAVQVSATADASSIHGYNKLSAYQLAKSAAALKRDLENAFVGIGSTQVATAGGAAAVRLMSGVQMQVAAGNINYMGAATNLSEAGLLIGLQAAYTAGADPSRILVTPSNSLIVTNFGQAAGRYRSIGGTGGDTGKIVNVVNIYVSPFGETKVVIDRFLRAKNTLIYDPDMWAVATLRPWTRESLAKTGDSMKQMIVGEFSLKHKNQSASAMTIDNATSGF